MPIPQRSFYMIRHGETEANLAKRMSGHMDTSLTALGRQQADAARIIVENLDEPPDVIIHSHLSRARDTASIINTNLNLPTYENPDYAEMHFGDWEGMPFEIHTNIQRSWVEWKNPPPNGESFDQFMNRIRTAKNHALALDYKNPLIVCHGGVFRAFAKLYNHDLKNVQNCHLHRFDPDKNATFPWAVRTYD